MKITIYVHEFLPQIGHSRAMIELLNGLIPDQKNMISSIEVVSFVSGSLEEIFPDFKCEKIQTQVPFGNLKPFIVKMFFYHLYTFFHSIFFASDRKKIGIGIACLNVDIVNIQFIHKQWEAEYFRGTKLSPLKKIYKIILFKYFEVCENYFFKNKNKRMDFIVIAKFMREYLINYYGTKEDTIYLIPSGVNTEHFNFSTLSKEELFHQLKNRYPVLKNLDITKPIALFVGAYERKGLHTALQALSKLNDVQFIIIGKPEQFSNFSIPKELNTFLIDFTKEVHLFYELCDLFIFPTRYEPFGLVIIEAYVMGMDLIVTTKNVGASEIIPQSEGITFIHDDCPISLSPLVKLSKEVKQKRRDARLVNLSSYTWKKAAETFYSILFKY